MNSPSNIESLLTRTPSPEAPSDLIDLLERDLRLSPDISAPKPRPTQPLITQLRSKWWPALGLGGALGVVFVSLLFVPSHGQRSLADSSKKLMELDSVRMVTYQRSGPGIHVWRDRSKPENMAPNYSTGTHPHNPLVKEETWFRRSPKDAAKRESVTIRGEETIWTLDNRELHIDQSTGKRSLRINPAQPNIDRMTAPLRGIQDATFHEAPQAPPTDNPLLANCWVGEHQIEGPGVNGQPPAKMIVRVWLDPKTELARRVELESHDLSEISPPWILQAWEFHDFNQLPPNSLFDVKLTEADAAQLGKTLAELDQLSDRATSIELNGEPGAKVIGTIRDNEGESTLEGVLPFTIVHDPKGETNLEFRMADGQARSFGIAGNGLALQTVATRIVASIAEDGTLNFSSGGN